MSAATLDKPAFSDATADDATSTPPAEDTTVTTEAAPLNPWAALAAVPVQSLKAVKSEADVPEAIRALVEQSHAAHVAKPGSGILAVTLPSKDLLKDFLKHLRTYADVREAGPLTIRTTVQGDGATVHVKAIDKTVRMLKVGETAEGNAAKSAEASAEATKTADEAPAEETEAPKPSAPKTSK